MQSMKCAVLFCLAISVAAAAQNAAPAQSPAPAATVPQPAPAQTPGPLKSRPEGQPAPNQFRVDPGTHILLSMINSVSTKQALAGDRIYLETAFPVLVNGRIIIPQGSWVTGTITQVKRPGRMKGRGELQVRFDSLTLPNGANRDFRADLGALDSRENETLNREGSKVGAPGDKKTDVGTVIGTTSAGTVIGSGIGAATRGIAGAGMGAGIGAGAGAAAGLLAVMLTRGPDATLNKGSTVEMVLDRPLVFSAADLDFSNAPPRGYPSEAAPAARPQRGLPSRIPY